MTRDWLPPVDAQVKIIQIEYPERGRMMVVADDWRAVYWLPRRSACLMEPIEAGVIEMVGDTDHLMEAEVEEEPGLIQFNWVYEYTVPTLTEHDRALRAHAVLTNPAAIARVMVANTTLHNGQWTELDQLQPVRALRWRQKLVLYRPGRLVCFRTPWPGDDLLVAPVLGNGTVDWSATYQPILSSLPTAEANALEAIRDAVTDRAHPTPEQRRRP